MKKKWAILIIVGAMAPVYLFLLVGIPALEDAVAVYGSYNSGETANNSAVSNITDNWTDIFPTEDSGETPLDVGPYRERYKPLILYFVPGLVGIAFIVKILQQKKEVK